MEQSLSERFRVEVIQVVWKNDISPTTPSWLCSYSTLCSNFGVLGGENRSQTFLSFSFCIKIAIFHSIPAFTRSEPRGPVCVPAGVHVFVRSQLIAHATGAISPVSNLYYFSSCLSWLTSHLFNQLRHWTSQLYLRKLPQSTFHTRQPKMNTN